MPGLKMAGSSSDFGEGLFVSVSSVIVGFSSRGERGGHDKVIWHS